MLRSRLLRIINSNRIIIQHPKTTRELMPIYFMSSQTSILTRFNNVKPRRLLSSQANALTLIESVQAVQREPTKKDTIAKQIREIAKQQPTLIIEQTSNDNSALHEAARLGNVEMINLLSKTFSEHFNVNHKCHCLKKRTPIAYAVEGGHEGAVEKLFSLGANPNITDERGWTALDYAIEGLKCGKNKLAFEKIALNISKHEGAAKKFPEEAKTLILKLEAAEKENLKQKAVNDYLSKYKAGARNQFEKEKERYLTKLKSITSGKKP